MPIYTCPKDPNHLSTDPDYCSVCGAKMDGSLTLGSTAPSSNGSYGGSALSLGTPAPSADAVATPTLGPELCPVCGTERIPGARFCEICRYNFETGNAHPLGSDANLSTPAATRAPVTPTVPAIEMTPPVFTLDSSSVPDALLAGTDHSTSSAVVLDDAAGADEISPLASGDDALGLAAEGGAPSVSDADSVSGLVTHEAPSTDSSTGGTNDLATSAPVSAPPTVTKWQITIIVDATLYTPDPGLPLPAGQPDLIFPLELNENLIGRRSSRRDAKPDIPINDPGVSHRHAKLYRETDGTWSLLDLGSTNGTRVNGADVQPGAKANLSDGDQITLGCWTRISLRELH